MTVETERTSVSPPGRRPLAAPRGPLRGLVAALPCILLLLLMALVTEVAAQSPSNGDTWFHLRVGHLFWNGWSLWHPGALTRFGTTDWVPSQWSTEMLSAKFEDWFGLPGVAWMYGVLDLGFLIAIYAAARRVAPPAAAVAAACGALFAASTTLTTRPQVVSLVLLAVTVGAWCRTQQDGRPRWWLVPMSWLWVTAHGLWVCGVVLGLVCWVGLVLDRRVRGWAAGRLLLVPGLSVAAALATPLGPKLLLSQLLVSERTPMIAEWGPTSFRTLPALVFALMVAVVLVLWLRGGQVPWMSLLMLGLACGWAMLVTRLVALAAIVVAPLLARALSHPLRDRSDGQPPRSPRAERLVIAVSAVACVAGLAVAAPSTAAHPAGVPTGFAPRLAALPRNSSVLVEDSSGAWMEWRFPGVQPVVDGLLDAYPVPYLEELARFWRAEPGWREFVVATGARVGVMKQGSPATTALREELHWRVLRRDRQWVYLVAPGSAR